MHYSRTRDLNQFVSTQKATLMSSGFVRVAARRESRMDTRYQVSATNDNGMAAARSRTYKAFARIFSYPGNNCSYAEITDPLVDSVSALVQQPAYALLLEDPAAAADAIPDDLDERYTQMFISGRDGFKVSLRESEHRTVPQNQTWEDLIRFYEHFNLVYDLHTTREPPDHLIVELDFMHFLTFVEAGAQEPAPFVRGQKDFLERHLVLWLRRFAAALTRTADSRPYGHLADLVSRFVEADLAYLTQRLSGPAGPC